MGRIRSFLLGLALAAPFLVPATAARGGPGLEYRGSVLARREVEALAQDALHAPRDSSALSSLLGALVARLQSQGYLDARASASWDEPRAGVLAVRVAEGPRYRLSEVVLRTPSGADSARLARTLALAAGDVASPAAVGVAIARALDDVVDHGHPYAQLGVGGWEVDSSGVRLTLSGGLGPLVTVTRVRFEGLKVTRPAVLEKSMGRLSGLPYHRASAEGARQRLAQLGLFRRVSLEGLEGEGDWSRAHLLYRVEEPRYNRFEGVLGVQGQAGVVGLASLDLDNLLGTARAVGLRWESRGGGVVSLAARYAEPLVLGAPIRLEGSLAQQVQDTLYARTRWGARARFALSGQEGIEAGYERDRVVQERVEVEQADVQSTVFALERNALDGALDPRRGSAIRIAAAQSFKTERLRPQGRRTSRASAVEIRAEWHRPATPGSGVALELQSAGRFSSEPVLPFFERYPIGGAGSLRGYDEEAFRVDRYALTRLEWRWFLGAGAQRAFVFWDHAWAATRAARTDSGTALESWNRDGIGIGLRLEAAGGLVGLDYGLEPGRPPLEGKIHLKLVSTF